MHVRVRVRVNRVDVRWERTLTTAALLERADGMIGADVASVRDAMGDRWKEIEPGRRYFLELPYQLSEMTWFPDVAPELRSDLGFPVVVAAGRVSEVAIALDRLRNSDEAMDAFKKALRARWGQPRVPRGETATWTWRTANRAITAEFFGSLVIRALR